MYQLCESKDEYEQRVLGPRKKHEESTREPKERQQKYEKNIRCLGVCGGAGR